jgi:hypothetical protein
MMRIAVLALVCIASSGGMVSPRSKRDLVGWNKYVNRNNQHYLKRNGTIHNNQDNDFTRSMTAIYASEVASTRKLLKYQAEQEQIKQRNRRKSDQQQMHDRLLQLKMICHCGYGFCQGPMKACEELMNLETLLYG